MSTARTSSDTATWTTVLNSDPVAVTRWAEPTTLAVPATLMLYSPGQYSPSTSPTRASTSPSPRSTRTWLSALAANVALPACRIPVVRSRWSITTAPAS
ncbi:hypothetical protein ACVDFE_28185 [Lentzea chajnantorensis]